LEINSSYFSIYIKQKDTYTNLVYGIVKSYFYDKDESTDRTVTDNVYRIKRKGHVLTLDYIINLKSMPITEKGMVNTMRVSGNE
jgi:pyruvate kinase